jgi:nitrogen-specific signal transduction histidine kinase
MAKSSLFFTVHPSVVYQLGESLITDAMVAIIELAKNSYDADASYSKIVIDTKGVTRPDDSYFDNDEGGIIIIEDDGCGMNIDDLRNGWLTISNRQKLDIKRNKKTTRKGRTPLGDKGLGRLGVQKLGKNLEVYTKKKGEIGYHIGFSWTDFSFSEKLENVEIKLNEIVYPKQSGTKIVISGLMEPELWKERNEKREGKTKKQTSVIKRLERELSRLISPYKEIRDFTVYIELDGKVFDPIEVSSSLRNNSLLKYKINFDGNNLLVLGKAKLDYFLPNRNEELKIFQNIVKSDDGRRFLKYIEKQGFSRAYKLTEATSKKWFIEFRYKKIFSEIDKIEYTDVDNNRIANPGPFFGEVDAFNLNLYDEKQHVFDSQSEYRNAIKQLSGIRVYRDGFAIKVDEDWLKLGHQWTSGSSYYGLKPINTLGFISLTARDNINLEETTDREGFKDTSYYRNFFSLLSEFVRFSSRIQDDLRTSWLEFRKNHEEAMSGIENTDTIEDVSQTLKKALYEAHDYKNNITVLKDKITKNKSTTIRIIDDLAKNEDVTSELRRRAIELLEQFRPLMDEADNTLNRMDDYISELNSLKDRPSIINERIKDLQRQMELMYESVALGLTAETLAHEINNVTDQLAIRAKAIKIDLSKRNIQDRNMLTFIEYVNSAVMALRKQMSFLSPALRYVREKRSIITTEDFINEIKAYFSERWGEDPISIKVQKSTNLPFSVKINKGKLIQIIDNLVLNSEYWLKEDIKQGKITKGIITIDISSPYIIISDNGRGIDANLEFTLFDPFITTKSNGRGLGLFIVKQLLDSEGCNIELLPERNNKKHLYKFRLDLGEIINE